MQTLIDTIKQIFSAKGYKFFENGDYNLNIIFVRNTWVYDDLDNDTCLIVFKVLGIWQVVALKCSTKGGVFLGAGGVYNPVTYNGVTGFAGVSCGQYLGAYVLEDASNNWLNYPFFKQVSNLLLHRDNNRDLVFDPDSIIQNCGTDAQIHIHRRSNKGAFSPRTGNYSIGCFTLDCPYLDILLHLSRQQILSGFTNRFSITVLNKF